MDPQRAVEEPEPDPTNPYLVAPEPAEQPPEVQPYVGYSYPRYPPSPPAFQQYAPQASGMAYASAPYGIDPYSGVPYSPKTKSTAGLLQLLLPFLGVCGVGRLYAGHTAIGLIQLIGFLVSVPLVVVLIGFPMLMGVWLWSVVDGIVMLTGNTRDGRGLPMR